MAGVIVSYMSELRWTSQVHVMLLVSSSDVTVLVDHCPPAQAIAKVQSKISYR